MYWNIGFKYAWSEITFNISFKPHFVDCWLVRIIFIGSAFIDPETCTWVWLQIYSWPYPHQTNRFVSPARMWEVMARVLVFVISPIAINALISFKEVPQLIQVCRCVGKCCPKGLKYHWVNTSQLFSEFYKAFKQKLIFLLVSVFW